MCLARHPARHALPSLLSGADMHAADVCDSWQVVQVAMV